MTFRGEELQNRTKTFSITVIRFLTGIQDSTELRVIKYQLIKSSTSVGANYRAVCCARSNAEFYSKMCIVVEEADETVYWLQLLQEIIPGNNFELDKILEESVSLRNIFSSSRRTMKLKSKN